MVRTLFIQVDTLDTVTSGRQRNRVIHDCRVVIRLAVPGRFAAEDDRTNRALYRDNGQMQDIDAVLAGTRLVSVRVGVRSGYTTQVRQPVPTEIIAFADGLAILEKITRLVFGQDQAVDIVASGLRVGVLELIGTRGGVGLLTCRTMVDILPCEAVVVRQRTICHINSRLIDYDMYVHQRVATQITAVVSGLVICNAVERDTAACADDKSGIQLGYFADGQIQNIVEILVVFLLYTRVPLGLISRYAVPFKR